MTASRLAVAATYCLTSGSLATLAGFLLPTALHLHGGAVAAVWVPTAVVVTVGAGWVGEAVTARRRTR